MRHSVDWEQQLCANTNTQVLDEAVSTIHRSFAAWLKATMSEAEPDPLRNHLRVVKRFCVYSTPLRRRRLHATGFSAFGGGRSRRERIL